MQQVARGRIQLGRILITAGKPKVMEGNSSLSTSHFTSLLQREQQDVIHISDYHIDAAALLLNTESGTLHSCLNKLGCLEWPDFVSPDQRTDLKRMELPDDLSELFTIMLQFGHLLSPLVRNLHPTWAKWMNSSDADNGVRTNDDSEMRTIAEALSKLFESVDRSVSCAMATLESAGYIFIEPRHLLQEATKTSSSRVPLLLLVAAVGRQKQYLSASDTGKACDKMQNCLGDIARRGVHSGTLGCWGYHDSRFTLQMNRSGQTYVTMTGSRYNICGKQLTKLIPFIEAEMQVKIDPNEDDSSFQKAGNQFPPSTLSAEEIKTLQSSGIEFSISTFDRARSGSGQSQEDVFLLRNNYSFRIPDAVVSPRSEREVVELVTLAKVRSWNLIPYGGGTNVTSATRCPPFDVDSRPVVSVCMQMMSRVLWVNEEDGLAHVEAGVTGQALSKALEKMGYTVGHEPDSMEFSTLGGWIATKASGMKKNKYGNIEDIVRSVRVVTSKGVAWQGFDGNNATTAVAGRESRGLDLCNIMFGSEGCFGIITSAVVRISALPECKDFECVLFADFDSGFRFVRDVAGLGHNIPASLRLFDNAHFRLGQALRAAPSLLQTAAKWAFLSCSGFIKEEYCVSATVAYEGSREEVLSQKRTISRLTSRHGGIRLGSRAGLEGYDLTFVIAYLRDFALSYGMMAESFETFAPWSKVIQIMETTKSRIEDEHKKRCLPGKPFVGCRITQVYHEGVCLYFYLCMNVGKIESPSSTFASLERCAREQILKSGGSLTHHHGVGKLRAPFTKSLDSDSFKEIIKTFKKSIDEENIFGAGNGLFS